MLPCLSHCMCCLCQILCDVDSQVFIIAYLLHSSPINPHWCVSYLLLCCPIKSTSATWFWWHSWGGCCPGTRVTGQPVPPGKGHLMVVDEKAFTYQVHHHHHVIRWWSWSWMATQSCVYSKLGGILCSGWGVEGVSAHPNHLGPGGQEVQDPGTQGGVQSQLNQLVS